MKPLVITVGDPLGIGPEVACKALFARRIAGAPVHAVLVGQAEAIRRAAAQAGIEVVEVDGVPAGVPPGVGGVLPGMGEPVPFFEPSGEGPVEVRSIVAAVEATRQGSASALVTGPVDKAAIVQQGVADFRGHTELIGELCGGAFPVMGFAGGRFRMVLVTTHLALRDVPDAITADRVLRVMGVAAKAMRDQLGIANPRLIVCGLNPHAGERGLLGSEDADEIAPAVERARLEGIDAVGPVSAEHAFRMVEGERDVVVAMYHDQGLVPLKLVDFGKSVNWTLGLPIIRTSVDHGTARDIAWTDSADPASMGAAIAWAERLVATLST